MCPLIVPTLYLVRSWQKARTGWWRPWSCGNPSQIPIGSLNPRWSFSSTKPMYSLQKYEIQNNRFIRLSQIIMVDLGIIRMELVISNRGFKVCREVRKRFTFMLPLLYVDLWTRRTKGGWAYDTDRHGEFESDHGCCCRHYHAELVEGYGDYLRISGVLSFYRRCRGDLGLSPSVLASLLSYVLSRIISGVLNAIYRIMQDRGAWGY